MTDTERRLQLAHQARRAKEHQLDDIRRALCDAGLMRDDDPYSHADLADVIRQTAEVHRQTTAAEPPARHTADSITDDELDALYAELARLRGAGEGMAVRLPDGLNPDRATDESPGPENATQAGTRGSAVLTVTVTAPTQENAGQWAATIRDLIAAEHGDEMRLDMTISPPPASLGGPEAAR